MNLAEQISFAENAEQRCPVVVLVDKSGSMSGEPIAQLNAGLAELRRDLLNDPLACLRVELSLLSFNSTTTVDIDFVSPEHFTPADIAAGGSTNLGFALNTALDRLKQQTDKYRAAGITYYKPWLFLITDAKPDDDLSGAALRIKEAEAKRKLAFFPIGVLSADMATLATLSNRPPLQLDGLNFRELFLWLSASLSSVAASMPGDQVPLTPPNWSAV